MVESTIQKFTPAERLKDILKTISNEPLTNPREFTSFYRHELNDSRGNNQIAMIKLGLQDAHYPRFFKSFVLGHGGVGKSTELTGISDSAKERFNTIRFSVEKDLDPENFEPSDVLLLMVALVGEKCACSIEEGGTGRKPSEQLLRSFLDWFAIEKETVKKATLRGAKLAAGAGISEDSLWAKTLGLFANFKSEVKYNVTRETETITHRNSRFSDLIVLANSFFDECNTMLKEASDRQWLFIGEDFDKNSIKLSLTEKLFISYRTMWPSLRVHFIFTLPIQLAYHQAAQLPPIQRFIIPDIPVYDQDHKVHREGRNAIQAVLTARVSPALFADGQMERLIVASGGNIRDLFTMVTYASNSARIHNNEIIEKVDVDSSISEMRSEYRSQLGSTGYENIEISVDEKINKLLAIYHNKPRCDLPDAILYSLLRSRAVQEFNGKRWFGVHPIVVDYLDSLGEIELGKNGFVPGGLI